MMRIVLFWFSIALLIIMPSCRKEKKLEPKRSLAIGIPYDNDSLMPPVSGLSLPPDLTIKDVWGVFIANNQTRIIKDVSGNVKKYDYPWQQAIFLTYAGRVTLNDSALVALGPPTSCWNSDPSLWNRHGNNTWYASGNNNNMPVIQETVAGTFPLFNGLFRDTLFRDGFSYRFDETNTLNADSAYVILYVPKIRKMWFSDVVSARGGIASFKIYSPRTDAVNDYFWIRDQLCYGALLEVVLLNYEMRTVEGKPFAFVRQQQVLYNKPFYE
jgi:hypothetical protein